MENVAEVVTVEQLSPGDKVLIAPSCNQRIPLHKVFPPYTDIASAGLPTMWRIVMDVSSSIACATRIEVISVDVPTESGDYGICLRAGSGNLLWFLDSADYGHMTVTSLAD